MGTCIASPILIILYLCVFTAVQKLEDNCQAFGAHTELFLGKFLLVFRIVIILYVKRPLNFV